MNINSIVNQFNEAVNMSAQGQTDVSKLLGSELSESLELLLGKGANAFISGQIMSVEGDKVQILLGENTIIDARLEGNMKPVVGNTMSFVVTGNDQNRVSLSPLFENTSQLSTVNSALDAAGLPNNPKMQMMVKSMMEEGLPIDRQSLYAMNKSVMAYPDANIESLTKMTALKVPINQNTIVQFENYLNYENTITDTLDDVSESFSDTCTQQLSLTDFSKENIKFVLDIANVLLSPEETEISGQESLLAQRAEIQVDASKMPSEEILQRLDNNDIKGLCEDVKGYVSNQNPENNHKMNAKEIVDVLTKAIDTAETKEEIEHISDALKTIVTNKNFKDMFKNEIGEKLMMRPEELAKEDSVSKLFEKMENTFKNIAEKLEMNSKTDTPLQVPVNNINSNLEFMNQLNQTFNYVQIPLKMLNQNASGELYVYSNKRSLAKDDKNVSALLHLDMDNLGPVDVHVTLNEANNVKTKFFLKDDEALDIIAENISVLDERLSKRGYSMSSEFVMKDETKTVLETVLDDNRNISMISSGSFDARA